MISLSWLCNTLIISSILITASPALAYRPLTGLYENGLNATVVTHSVSTSLSDKDGLLDSNWDTTIVLEQKDARDVAWVEVTFSLLGSQNSPVRVRKVVLNRDHPWRKGERWEYRLQENHLGWPGDATLVRVTTVAFTNGEFWGEGFSAISASPSTSTEQLPPVPQETAKTVEPAYIPPTVLPGSTSSPAQPSPSTSGFIPRPRVAPSPSNKFPQPGISTVGSPRVPITPEELMRKR
jgi:hypothetical protein